jgi:hypothetical protein
MKSLVRGLLTVRITVAVLVLFGSSFADTPAPTRDFKKTAGEYVFVMLGPRDGDRFVQQVPEIRNVYKQSGLYRNDDSNTPLWTVDWYTREVFANSDGEHLVAIWSERSSIEAPAVSFYRNGRELKSYRIKDLVRSESQLRRSVTFLHWMADVTYHDKGGLLLLRTTDHRIHRFSVRTGEILR